MTNMPPRPNPRYQQIADELRRRIAAGAIPPGAALPSEPTIAAEFKVSVPTVRQALGELRAEGLVVTEHGRATFVRPQVPIRRVMSDRYKADVDQVAGGVAPETSFTRDQRLGWDDYRLDANLEETPADNRLAELFDVDPGTMLLRRRLVFYAHGYPQQLSYSHFLLDLVAGTPVADQAREPWPGGSIAQLASLGVAVTSIREEVRSRMPSSDEVAALRVSPGVPVLTITRRMFAGDRVVEAAVDIVIPADRVVLDYRIEL